MVPLDSEAKRPENYKDLVSYLKGSGRLQQTTSAQLYQARHLYITKGLKEQVIASELDIPAEVVQRWVVLFDWRGRRDEHLFGRFCKAREIMEKRGLSLDERHDRIALTLEETLERMLHKHEDPDDDFMLHPKDLKMLVSALRDSQHVRRVAHGKDVQKVSVDKHITLDASRSMGAMVSMMEDLFGEKPKLTSTPLKQITATTIPEIVDAEFDEVSEQSL